MFNVLLAVIDAGLVALLCGGAVVKFRGQREERKWRRADQHSR
jgi:hypothetical protein